MAKFSAVLSILLVLALCLSGCRQSSADESNAYETYISAIDKTCEKDSDCVVRDVGNCCGYYPQCVNSAASIDREKVTSWCEEKGMASICGFPVIESCRCQDHVCVNVEQTGAIQ
jgi:hypothetical protein